MLPTRVGLRTFAQGLLGRNALLTSTHGRVGGFFGHQPNTKMAKNPAERQQQEK